jgi:hypothetical protein
MKFFTEAQLPVKIFASIHFLQQHNFHNFIKRCFIKIKYEHVYEFRLVNYLLCEMRCLNPYTPFLLSTFFE